MGYIEWLRGHVGKRKIFLVFATVIVVDDDGRILIQRRTDFAFWGLPGGVMELNEDIQSAARREVLEETGLTLGKLSLVGEYSHPRFDVTYPNGDEVQQFTFCFWARWVGGAMHPDGDETSFQTFVSPQNALHRSLPIWYRQMILDFEEKKKVAFTLPFSKNEVVDQIGMIRPFVGHQPIIAVGSMALIVYQEQVLMIKRADTQSWIFPAGFCDLGENAAQTAVRETEEETGLKVKVVGVTAVYSSPQSQHTYPNGDVVQNVGILFECRVVGGDLISISEEVSAWGWVNPIDIPDKIAPPYRIFGEKVAAYLTTTPAERVPFLM